MKKTNFSAYRFSILSCVMLIFLLPGSKLVGQCSAPDQLPYIECEHAPLICLQNWCTESGTFEYSSHYNFCGNNTILNNPQYYAFIALEEDVEIHIQIGYCNSNGEFALQAALLGTCPWDLPDVIDCHPGAPPGGTIILHSYGLMIPGEQYYLLIDGYAGSICEYTIIETHGIYGPEITGEISSLTATPSILVQGSSVWVELSSTLNFAHGYYWVADWSSDTLTSTLPLRNIEIPCGVIPGQYTICARGFSGCDTTETEVCTVIEIMELEDVVKPPSILCPSQLPYQWFNISISSPGTYIQQFYNADGCYYDSIWQVSITPEMEAGLIDTTVCYSPFVYEGQFYDTPGMYELHYPGGGLNGCDSLAVLHLSMDELNLFVEVTCVDSHDVLRPHVIEHFLRTDSIFYSWYDCTYDSLLSTSPTFTPDSAGCYCLIAEHGICSDTICSTYLSTPCPQTCSLVQERSCTGDAVIFTYESEMPEGATFHWLIDRPEAPAQYYSGNDSVILDYLLPECYAASLTIVSGDSTFSCRDSICVFSPASLASICCDQTACDSCARITVELSGASPWTLYFSHNSSTDTVFDVRQSPYLHLVCPPYDSTITYQLLVTDSASQCPAIISGESSVSIRLFEDPEFTIVQHNDTLCIDIQDIAGIQWKGCIPGQTLSTSPCFTPLTSGCYCADVTSQEGCTASKCYDFIISSVTLIPGTDILIKPIPTTGTFDIHLSSKIHLPVKWTLVDGFGRALENGKLDQHLSTIRLKQVPPPGVYYLQIVSSDHQMMTSKLVIEAR